jgi:hypothetical protein
MPRSQSKHSETKPSSVLMSRTSYTGPLMPRPTPMQTSSPSFMQTVKEGVSFGVGTSIARNLVDRVFGTNSTVSAAPPVATAPPVVSVPPQPVAVDSMKSIAADQLLYHKCMQDGGKHEICKDYLV